jgi:hypothetical protein
MPCDSIIKMSIELKALNRPMLVRALEKEGWTVRERRGVIYATDKNYDSIEIHPDRAVVDKGNEDLVGKIYDAYTKENIRTQVKQYGAKLESVPGQKNQWKVTLPQFSKSAFTQKSTF